MSVLKSICLYFKSMCLYFCLSRSFPFHSIILFTHIWSEIDGTLADAAHQHTNTHTHSQTNTHTDSETGTERKIGTWIGTWDLDRDFRARGKRRRFSAGAAARHSQSARVPRIRAKNRFFRAHLRLSPNGFRVYLFRRDYLD
jgi:hypothetical protein